MTNRTSAIEPAIYSMQSEALKAAQIACTPHSLCHNGAKPVHKTWTKVAVAAGIAGWGYEPVYLPVDVYA